MPLGPESLSEHPRPPGAREAEPPWRGLCPLMPSFEKTNASKQGSSPSPLHVTPVADTYFVHDLGPETLHPGAAHPSLPFLLVYSSCPALITGIDLDGSTLNITSGS